MDTNQAAQEKPALHEPAIAFVFISFLPSLKPQLRTQNPTSADKHLRIPSQQNPA